VKKVELVKEPCFGLCGNPECQWVQMKERLARPEQRKRPSLARRIYGLFVPLFCSWSWIVGSISGVRGNYARASWFYITCMGVLILHRLMAVQERVDAIEEKLDRGSK